MANFKESSVQDTDRGSLDAGEVPAERSIGSIIAETRSLSSEQVEKILVYQRDKGIRFGEAAILLGYASSDDVLFALAQQFHYPYAAEKQRMANPELVALNQPFGIQAESFRAIRSQIMMRALNEKQERCAIAVVSPDPGDGKTFFSANLAVTLAQLGGRTLLVDADMRGPRQHQVFGLSNSAGLSGILSGRAEFKVIQQVPDVPSLFLLPVGITPPNPLELVERPAFGLLIRELLSKFDHVVVDTPAGLYGSDGAVIASRCGAAMVVARKDKSKVASLQSLVSNLAETPAKTLGVIFNEY
jgi:chain length determinant protein tyrosine kinase EpsG